MFDIVIIFLFYVVFYVVASRISMIGQLAGLVASAKISTGIFGAEEQIFLQHQATFLPLIPGLTSGLYSLNKMKKDSFEIAGYAVLPLQLPPTPTFPKPATHYLYLRPHEPRIPDPDSPRSLFLVNIPIDTTELHIRHLFGKQLAAGRVETVHFENVPTKKHATSTQGNTSNIAKSSNKKRKRITADDLQNALDEIELPATWDRQLQKSGAHAIVVFADRPSMETSLRAATKAAKKGSTAQIIWGEGIEHRVPALGFSRYQNHSSQRYPDRAALLHTVNDYMVVFTQVSEARKREEARKAQEPDDDGFTTVTSGPKLNSTAREEETQEMVERQRKKEEGLEDFYRFQSREKRKERQNELLRGFDEDRRKLDDMKRRKGKIRVSCLLLLFFVDDAN